MSWVQVKSPNLNVQTSIGMCLEYVQDAYGSGWAGSYALQGWHDIVKKKHPDWNIPGGVYVPIWFEGYWNGVNYGHVAIYKDGVCWSSPYTNKGTHDQLGNIETVERIYGMKYIGWSEDIGGTTVSKEEDDIVKPSEKEVVDTFNAYLLKPPVDKKQIAYYTGQDVRVLYKDVLGATRPQAAEINKAFSELLPGTTDKQRVPYYSGRSWKQLYSDIAYALHKQLDKGGDEYVEVKEKLYKKK